MHIERAVFFFKLEQSKEFRMMAQRGLAWDSEFRLRRDHPLVTWLSTHEQALTRYDIDVLPQFKALWGEERKDLETMGAELLIPLKAKGELVGILAVGAKRSGQAYQQDDQLTLTTLANQTATALENARLHEETRRRNRELTLLNRVIAASATNHPMEWVLQTICGQVSLAFGVSQTIIALFSEEKTEALIVADYALSGPSPQQPGGHRNRTATGNPASSQTEQTTLSTGTIIPIADHPLFEHQLTEKAVLVLDDSQMEPHLAPIYGAVRSRGIVSLLALPLIVDGNVVGSLCLNSLNPHPFSTEELDLARRVAEQVSGAVARSLLTEMQQRLTTAVEAVVITETDGSFLYVNPAFEQISGYSSVEALELRLQDLPSDKHGNPEYQTLWLTIQTGKVWQGRLINKKRDGTLYTADTTITPVRNQAGEIVNYVATMRDVTREVQLEHQFYQSQKMEALGRFAGGIAHDFNNLLTIIHLSTRILQRQMSPEDPWWDNVQRIQETGERAAKLTRQLLSFSRREMIESRVMNLNQLVSNLIGMLQRIIGEDIELITDLAEDLSSVKADPSQMEQVIVNLAVNARDAMPRGGTLRIGTANVVLDQAYVARHVDALPGEYAMLAVSDNGEGMDEEIRAHVFEPFFTTKDRGQGTGLGLSTVFGIVKQSDGHITVETEVQQGTTFRIYLPRTQAREETVVTHSRPAVMAQGTETILLAEDEADVRDLTAHTLRTQGYQVLTAVDGLHALQVSREHDGPIHLLLSDVVMPHIGGSELAKRLKLQRPEMRVLYMSGYVDKPLVRQFTSNSTIAFLAKPFSEEELVQKVQSALQDRS
jgi:PAS domain S-box-containing protein